MYLHENKSLFKDIIADASRKSGLSIETIEKDYYVSMVLQKLAISDFPFVFKGGTSLSKAHKIIDRFSEDIDISLETHIGASKRKKVKYNVIKRIADELKLIIGNFENTQSDRQLNHYDFYYDTISIDESDHITPFVKLEISLMTNSFPSVNLEISNFIFDYLSNSYFDLLSEYNLLPFQMKTQSIERTYIDKIFAVCDYYLTNKSNRNSRHLYDIYKISSIVDFEKVDELFELVREERLKIGDQYAPSANNKYKLSELFQKILDEDFFKNDYTLITSKLINEDISYEEVKKSLYYNIKLLKEAGK